MINSTEGLSGLAIVALTLSALCTFGSSQASAATAADCRANWNTMKTAGTTPAGVKYNQYIHDCVSGTAASAPVQGSAVKAAPAQGSAAKVAVPPAATAKMAPAAVAPAVMPTTTPDGACTIQYDLALIMRKIPTGQSKDVFLRNCMAKSATSSPATQATVPTAPVPQEPPATGGQAGEVSRIQACGKEWHQLKDANRVPKGTKWPQFWSECDKQLKAQGL